MRRTFTLRQRARQRNVWKQRIVLGAGLLLFTFVCVFSYSSLFKPEEVKAQSSALTTFQGGSFIINMGWSPQTVNNGLKPYGLVYDLVVNSGVPVAWVINPSKAKDGNDFTHELYNYRGGTFVVPGEFITADVANKIVMWQLQGVMGRYAQTAFAVPVYETITSYPRVMIDSLSGLQNVIVSYFTNAGIPATAYQIGAPSGLSACFDVWANPHGDPVWSTHSPLFNFVTANKGYVYAQCHSVSMMENSVTGNPVTNQLNFLSTNGLKCWKSSGCEYAPETHPSGASTPYTYFYPSDPIMQFIGTMQSVTSGGSEQYYIPLSTGGWRSTTKVGVSTSDGASPRQGTILVYGPAYGNSNNGGVLYIGGHTLVSGSSTDQVAAQRAFHNFMLRAGIEKKLQLSAVMPPDNMGPSATAPVSVTVAGGSPGYTYQWTSTLGGSFANSTASSTTYTSPSTITQDTVDIVRIRVTDACGRSNIIVKVLRVGPTLPVRLIQFSGQKSEEGVLLKWTTASETNNDHFIIDRSKDGYDWELVGKPGGAGNSNSIKSYQLRDREPFPGINIYRISQVDFDGRSENLRSISIRFEAVGSKPGRLNIQNSLFSDAFQFLFQSEVEMTARLRLFDATGRMADDRKFELKKGSQLLTYQEDGLKSGVYYIVFELEDGTSLTSRVVKM